MTADKAIDRIQKLLRLSEGTDNEAEAASAAAIAAQIMERAGLIAAEVAEVLAAPAARPTQLRIPERSVSMAHNPDWAANDRQSDWAEAGLLAYELASDVTCDEFRTRYLITALLHLTSRDGGDPMAVLTAAVRDFQEETSDDLQNR